MLRGVFHRGTAALTCEIDAADRHHFDVCVVPHWDVASSLIEHFDDPISAFERHADIARRLREAGWTSADHVATPPTRSPRRAPAPLAASSALQRVRCLGVTRCLVPKVLGVPASQAPRAPQAP
jgi:hypothetical protein